MVCCIVLKPKVNSQSLFLNRQKQSLINDYIASYLKYKPFVFNSSRGMYIFTKKNESFEEIENILYQVFTESDLEKIRIFDTSLSPDFFVLSQRKYFNQKKYLPLHGNGLLVVFSFRLILIVPNQIPKV